MTPDARVQEAVERAKAWNTSDVQTSVEKEIYAATQSDDTLDHVAQFGYACGLLASTPETERLRSALKAARSALRQAEHRLDDFHGTEAIQSVCAAAARDIDSLLTPPRDPQ